MKGLFNFLIVGVMAALAIAAENDGEQMVSVKRGRMHFRKARSPIGSLILL
jgi:hypothetical protein